MGRKSEEGPKSLTSNIRLSSKCCNVCLVAFFHGNIMTRRRSLVVTVIRPGLGAVSQLPSLHVCTRERTIQFSAPSMVLKLVPCSG